MIKVIGTALVAAVILFSVGCGQKALTVAIGCDIEKAEVIVNGQPTAVVVNEKAELKLLPGNYDLLVKTISYGEQAIKVEVKKESKNEFIVNFLGTVILNGVTKGNEILMNNQKVAVIEDESTSFTVKLEPGTYEFIVKSAKGKKTVTAEVKAGETTEKTM